MRLIATVVMLFLAGAVLAQSGTRDFAIPGHGSLKLAVPPGYDVAQKSVNEPPAVAIRMVPFMGNAWHLQITAVRVDPAKASQAPPLRERVQRTADGLLPRAVEKQATVLELRGSQSAGYYFSLQDRESKNSADDYPFLTQGTTMVGEITTIFTLLSAHASMHRPIVEMWV